MIAEIKYSQNLTNTHLKKSTLNGSALAALIGPTFDFSFDKLKNGESFKIPAFWSNSLELENETFIKFYKPKSKAEKRFSIPKLTSKANAGQTLKIVLSKRLKTKHNRPCCIISIH